MEFNYLVKMTKILSFLFLIISISGFSQHTSDNKFIYIDDTTEIIDFLNGTWKFKEHGETHKMKFNFDKKTLTSYHESNIQWYDNEKVKFELRLEKYGKIYLCEYVYDVVKKEFPKKATYKTEIWLIDPKLFAMNINGDYGIYLVEKVRN